LDLDERVKFSKTLKYEPCINNPLFKIDETTGVNEALLTTA